MSESHCQSTRPASIGRDWEACNHVEGVGGLSVPLPCENEPLAGKPSGPISPEPIKPLGAVAGFALRLRSFAAARAERVILPAHELIEENSHEWHSVTILALGRYALSHGDRKVWLDGPSAVFHPAGASHAKRVAEDTVELVTIHFLPSWLEEREAAPPLDRTVCWSGGCVVAAARLLAAKWADDTIPEGALRKATRDFLDLAFNQEVVARPAWIAHVLSALSGHSPPPTQTLARQLDLHPAWLARAYRAAMGEGVQETVRRRRVERATSLLRNTDWSLAEIALAAGFCDQSHMNRGFRVMVGRTPRQVRAEAKLTSGGHIAPIILHS